jgi:hypothetical protein
MSANPKEIADSTDSVPDFNDWSDDPDSEYQYLNDEIIEFFGNPINKPDTNNGSCIRHDMDGENARLDEQYWRKMSLYNSGISNLKWSNSEYRTYILNKGMIESLMCQLDLTQRQREQVYPFLMGLDFGKFGKKVEITAFCAIVTTINNDDTKRSYHPQQKEDNKPDRVEDDRPDDFVRVKNSLRISDKDLFSMMAKLDPANPQNNPEVSTSYLEFEKRDSGMFD